MRFALPLLLLAVVACDQAPMPAKGGKRPLPTTHSTPTATAASAPATVAAMRRVRVEQRPLIETFRGALASPRGTLDAGAWAGGALLGIAIDDQSETWTLLRWSKLDQAPSELMRTPGVAYGGCMAVAPQQDRIALGVYRDKRRGVVVIRLDSPKPEDVMMSPKKLAAGELFVPCETVWDPAGTKLAVGIARASGAKVLPSTVQIHQVDGGRLLATSPAGLGLEPVRWDREGLLLREPISVETTDEGDRTRYRFYRWQPAQGAPEPTELLARSPDGRLELSYQEGINEIRASGGATWVLYPDDGFRNAITDVSWLEGDRVLMVDEDGHGWWLDLTAARARPLFRAEDIAGVYLGPGRVVLVRRRDGTLAHAMVPD